MPRVNHIATRIVNANHRDHVSGYRILRSQAGYWAALASPYYRRPNDSASEIRAHFTNGTSQKRLHRLFVTRGEDHLGKACESFALGNFRIGYKPIGKLTE